MVKLWVTKINNGLATIDDVPERYLEAVRLELGITD